MQKRDTQLEKGLRVSAIILLICGLLLLAFPFLREIKQYQQEVFSLGLFIMTLNYISKIFRFYKQANIIINTIWIVSIILILLGSAMYYSNWGWFGIAGWGIVAFNFTWGYSFLGNKPEIK